MRTLPEIALGRGQPEGWRPTSLEICILVHGVREVPSDSFYKTLDDQGLELAHAGLSARDLLLVTLPRAQLFAGLFHGYRSYTGPLLHPLSLLKMYSLVVKTGQCASES